MKRAETGAAGLDALLGGGLARHSVTLVTGESGTGKTVLCLSFLHRGALYREPGVLACFNEPPKKMRANAAAFGWNLAALEKSGRLALLDASGAHAGLNRGETHALKHTDFDAVLHGILETCSKIKAKRLVIDSLSSMLARVPDRRAALHRLANALEEEGITALVTSESMRRDEDYAEEQLADAVIALKRCDGGRFLEVKKARGSAHTLYTHPYRITESGFSVEKASPHL